MRLAVFTLGMVLAVVVANIAIGIFTVSVEHAAAQMVVRHD